MRIGLIGRGMTGASLLVIAAVSANPAYAQAADDAAANSDEIIVTARKVAENIQDVPVTITVFTGEKLESQGIREVGEIAKYTPGFNVRGAGNNPTAFALSMRGQIQNDNIATLEPSVGIYLDDIYVARAYGLNVDMLDMSNAQVLKGSQGTLFGRNTSAGAVLLQTNDPKFDELSGTVRATYGRFNERSGLAIVNYGASNFAVRGALSYGERDGYKTDVYTGRKYEGRKTLQGRVKVAFKPTDTLTVLLSGEWYDGKVVGPARQNLFYNHPSPAVSALAAADRVLFAGNPDLVAITNPALVPGSPAGGPYSDMKTQSYGLKFTLDTGFGELKWINGYRRVKGAVLIDLDGSSPVSANHSSEGFQDLKQWSSELQMTGSAADNRLNYAVGMTYFKERGTDASRSNTGGNIWSGFVGDIDNNSMGIYGQASYKVTDQLSFTGGLRYSIDDKGVTTQSAVYPNNGTVPQVCLPTSFNFAKVLTGTLTSADCNRTRSDSFKNLSYTFGVDFKINDDLMLFAKHSKGYRSGAQQLRTLTLTDTAPAQPEINHEQEIGFKGEFMDGRLRFNISGYHNKISNAQRSVILNIGGVNQTVLENASTETWGVEADMMVRVADNFSLYANGSVTDPKYTRYDGFVAFGGALTPTIKTNTQFTGIVKKQFTLGADYSQETSFGKIGFNASYAWQGKMAQTEQTVALLSAPTTTVGGSGFTATQAADAIAALTTRAHGITNARATIAFGPEGNYELAVWGRNIFDQRATQYSLFLGGLNYIGTSWNDPATYGVTATVKF